MRNYSLYLTDILNALEAVESPGAVRLRCDSLHILSVNLDSGNGGGVQLTKASSKFP